MKIWWIVVRHSTPPPSGFYPPEGFAISAFDDEDQAKRFAAASTTPRDRYEAKPVAEAASLLIALAAQIGPS